MAQVQTQIQNFRREQQLKLSMQQLQMVKLLEMPLAEFEQSVKKEMMDNPALEEGRYIDDRTDDVDSGADESVDVNDTGDDPYSEPVDSGAIENIERYSDDDLPLYATGNGGGEERREIVVGDTGSFIEDLESQMMNYELDDTQSQVLRYLIGMLDHRGYISVPTATIVDELAFKYYIYVDEAYVDEMLRVLQGFEPAGIGAHDTRECLLLQIDRELSEASSMSELKERFVRLQRTVVADHYDLFIKRNVDRLCEVLGVGEAAVNAVFAALKKLNVNPGLSLGESASSRQPTQIPDFIIETDPDGNIEMHLNGGDVPRLHVRSDFIAKLKSMQADPDSLSRSEREGLLYTQRKVEEAQMFIESVKQRRRTLYETMKAIITLQRKYILTRDEDDKVRLVLKDVAKLAGYGVSTVSRVCNSKCCLLDGRIYQLQDFFMLTRKNAEGKDVDSREVQASLQSVIDAEDKSNPLSDDQLASILSGMGIKLARRTVTRYRQKLGIPSIADRKA